MKKTLSLILAITLIVTLIGCSDTTQNALTKSDSSLNPQTSVEKKYTKDDAIETFKKYKDFNNCEITDYVLVNDNKIPMLNAIISFYDKKKNNSSNLAFILGDLSQEVCFAVNEVEGVKTYEIADNSQLTYVGDGAVTTSIRKIDTNEVINYKIIFLYEESASATNFKIVAEKPAK
ncbi:hypothetical protein GOM49_10495 [Clostridium bovifaecis]|uniref:Lipoprotein n=1 Tax=Clostridium bovifaecis TaxID=2184719 RepID=A0A6I6EYU3_9CLOT|nr:hypothetical protein GOM49_10495 [Clostridium bovifaecis]